MNSSNSKETILNKYFLFLGLFGCLEKRHLEHASSMALFGPNAVPHHQFLIQELMQGRVLAQRAELPAKPRGQGFAVTPPALPPPRVSLDKLLSG